MRYLGVALLKFFFFNALFVYDFDHLVIPDEDFWRAKRDENSNSTGWELQRISDSRNVRASTESVAEISWLWWSVSFDLLFRTTIIVCEALSCCTSCNQWRKLCVNFVLIYVLMNGYVNSISLGGYFFCVTLRYFQELMLPLYWNVRNCRQDILDAVIKLRVMMKR